LQAVTTPMFFGARTSQPRGHATLCPPYENCGMPPEAHQDAGTPPLNYLAWEAPPSMLMTQPVV
jgi:hypothetical protein